MSVVLGNKEYFKGIGQIQYEGPIKEPLAFKWYDANKVVGGKDNEGISSFCNCILAYIMEMVVIHSDREQNHSMGCIK